MDKYLTLKDHVYNYISKQITSGELGPDDKINEQDICDVLNISRTPVREALIQLSSDGYLENIPRRGLYVKGMDEKRAKDLYELIGLLDGYIASSVVDKISEKDLKEMELIVNNMDFYIDSRQYDKYDELQEEFHAIYINKCHNNEMKDNLEGLLKNFMRKNLNYQEGEDEHEILKKTNEQHNKIIQLFRAKDSIELEKFIREVHWSEDTARFESW